MINNQHQMRTDAPGRGVPVGGVTRRFTPAADDAQGGLHSLPVGGMRCTSGTSTQLLSAAPYTCRGLHCATAFSIQFARRSPLVGLSVRRHVCILPNGRAATHSLAGHSVLHPRRVRAARDGAQIVRAVMAARRQISSRQPCVCQDFADVPEASLVSDHRCNGDLVMNTASAIVIIAAVLLIVVGLMVWHANYERRVTDRDVFFND